MGHVSAITAVAVADFYELAAKATLLFQSGFHPSLHVCSKISSRQDCHVYLHVK
jgi:hypothetical protein